MIHRSRAVLRSVTNNIVLIFHTRYAECGSTFRGSSLDEPLAFSRALDLGLTQQVSVFGLNLLALPVQKYKY